MEKLGLNLEANLKENFVAFIDVLGFKELVRSGNVKYLEEYFDKITETLDDLRVRREKVESFMISDSIILIAPPGLSSLKQLINAIRTIQSILLWRRILLRGAVSYGPVYYNAARNILVGMGFIKAYLLEQEAFHPRVIIDPSIIKLTSKDRTHFLNQINGGPEVGFQNRLVYYPLDNSLIPNDGIFIDYANKTLKETTVNGNLDRTYQLIRENLYSEQRLYGKYIWLRDYFAECLQINCSWLEQKNEKSDDELAYIKLLKEWEGKFRRL